jgi:type IV secretory pathway VirB2 component (pilin)
MHTRTRKTDYTKWMTWALILAITLLPIAAMASSASTGMPWETPFQSFYKSISGPVAFGISLLGIVVTGATLVFGGEINEFVRRGIMMVLVVAIIVSANSILTTLFSGGAATITPVAQIDAPAVHQ